jgi:nucleotide-binding universal stress UspA family protein
MLPFRKILCPVDFSEPSHEALTVANELASEFGSRLYVLNVITPVPVIAAPTGPITFNVPLYEENLKAAVEDSMRKILNERISKDLDVESIVTFGDAANTIIRTAEEKSIDLIVISTHGRTGWQRFLLGSVAEKVVRLAPCPVFAVRARGEGAA